MRMNPFKRSQRPLERLDQVRRGAAETARGVRDGADRVAGALDGSQDRRSRPMYAARAAAFLGVSYLVAKRLGLASAVTKQLNNVRSGVAESAGGVGDAAESAGRPPEADAATSTAGAPASGGGAQG